MRKFLCLLALLFVVSGARLAKADSTQSVTFNYNGGSLAATETLSNGKVTSVSIDGYKLNIVAGGSNSLLEGCEKSGCSWDLFDVAGSVILEVSDNGVTEYAGCLWCTNGHGQIAGGNSYGTSAVPEPPVYLLGLLGIVFTRNRISQGFRQALRWNR
jgi:hypothetical protein